MLKNVLIGFVLIEEEDMMQAESFIYAEDVINGYLKKTFTTRGQENMELETFVKNVENEEIKGGE